MCSRTSKADLCEETLQMISNGVPQEEVMMFLQSRSFDGEALKCLEQNDAPMDIISVARSTRAPPMEILDAQILLGSKKPLQTLEKLYVPKK